METQINGVKQKPYHAPAKDKRRTRSAASIRKQVKTAAANRKAALKEGRSYGHTPGKGNKLNPPRTAYKRAGASSRGAAIGDAVTYLRHARDRAARLGPEGYATLGLISLALEALGAE